MMKTTAIDKNKQYSRWQRSSAAELLQISRVVLISGPRQCGKTTLAKEFISSTKEYRNLDNPTLRSLAQSDPLSFVQHKGETLIIDEIQQVPELLSTIKMVVDENQRPGEYLLTGSSNTQSLPTVQESLAGRIMKVRLRTLTQGEIANIEPKFFTRAFNQDFKHRLSNADRDQLIEMAFIGGYPEALNTGATSRKRWHRNYLQALLERDLMDISRIKRKNAMSKLVEVLAAWSSKFMNVQAIGSKLSIHRETIESYISALQALFLIEPVKPWTKSDYARVQKREKIFMTDPGLMASILDWKFDQIRLDPDKLGKLIETFTFHEISAQIDAAQFSYDLFQYRDDDQREIDFLVERDDGALLGIEVKASSVVKGSDFKHLRWFSENLAGERPFVGIVLYAGERAGSFGNNMWAVPMSILWS